MSPGTSYRLGMLSVELKRRGKRSAISFDCLAVLVDAEANLYAVSEDGVRVRLAWRVGPSAWKARDGSKVHPPLVHDEGTAVLHLRGDEHASPGQKPWAFEGRPDTSLLTLRRRGDRAGTLCYLGPTGWGRLPSDIHQGSPEVMLAPAGFSLEQLYVGLAGKGNRTRLSALASRA